MLNVNVSAANVKFLREKGHYWAIIVKNYLSRKFRVFRKNITIIIGTIN